VYTDLHGQKYIYSLLPAEARLIFECGQEMSLVTPTTNNPIETSRAGSAKFTHVKTEHIS
jgi:hypothetical protein